MMKDLDVIRPMRMDGIGCQECGHVCSRYEFVWGINLCTHLALDELSARRTRQGEQADRKQRPGKNPIFSEETGDSSLCPRCRGFMVREVFCDLEINGKFEGWRCLSCGNIRDRVIARHEATASGDLAPQLSVRTTRPMAVDTKSSKPAGQKRGG